MSSKKYSVDQWLDDATVTYSVPRKHRRKKSDNLNATPTLTVWIDDTEFDENEHFDEELYHRRRKTRRVRRTVEIDY